MDSRLKCKIIVWIQMYCWYYIYFSIFLFKIFHSHFYYRCNNIQYIILVNKPPLCTLIIMCCYPLNLFLVYCIKVCRYVSAAVTGQGELTLCHIFLVLCHSILQICPNYILCEVFFYQQIVLVTHTECTYTWF